MWIFNCSVLVIINHSFLLHSSNLTFSSFQPDYYRDAPHFHRIGDGPEYSLEIPQAKLDYTGTYTVFAKNCHGDAKAIISLQIKIRGKRSSVF